MAQRRFGVEVGKKLPSAAVSVVRHDGEGWKNEIVDTSEYLANKTVVLVGYPGAFTPTCMQQHIPGYIASATQITSGGADEIIAMSVNDPFVVTAFADKLDGKQLVNYMADGNGEFTKALGLDFDLSAVSAVTFQRLYVMMSPEEEVEGILSGETPTRAYPSHWIHL